MIEVQPSGQACGAQVRGVDFSQAVDADTLRAVRAAWMEHHVLAFPDQHLRDPDLERITAYFGALGEEPFFGTIEGSDHVVELSRLADEKAPLFAENWHSDWSFLAQPPIGTLLYSLVIPPVGGNTGFINQQRALAAMPAELRRKLEGRSVRHSAAAAYAPDGMYGDRDTESDRSMKIIYAESAREEQVHPLITRHPESGNDTLLGCIGYICGIEGMEDAPAQELLLELFNWQTREEFQYTHEWQPHMLVMWDIRSVLHRAYGGYEGHDRILHRT
ncbi:MAG: TauD/TfdA family dioxygenase, partial [Halioglobus sp.]|nr:TauD/TfdA family dioxygenase [Halioglobus sp.]